MNLHIVALFKFNDNYLIEAVELFHKLVKETRKENGCLQYDLIEDNSQKGTFFLIELWETLEHHSIHMGQNHLLEFFQSSAKFLEKTSEVYKGYKIY